MASKIDICEQQKDGDDYVAPENKEYLSLGSEFNVEKLFCWFCNSSHFYEEGFKLYDLSHWT